MTTKPSSAPWADEPFALMSTPAKELLDTHGCFRAAAGMTRSHNILLRGLNAIVQQGPCIPTSLDKHYRLQLVKDFLRYVHCWTKAVSHHHWIEESFFFPELEKQSNQPGRMTGSRHEHGLFEAGLEKLSAYTANTEAKDFQWHGSAGMKSIIDKLSEPLVKHLYAEIDVILALKDLDSEMVKTLWAQVATNVQQLDKKEMWCDIYPYVFGTTDATFEGGNAPNKLPWFMPYLIKYWYALGDGAWQFGPCDFWGTPRPLAFTAESL